MFTLLLETLLLWVKGGGGGIVLKVQVYYWVTFGCGHAMARLFDLWCRSGYTVTLASSSVLSTIHLSTHCYTLLQQS